MSVGATLQSPSLGLECASCSIHCAHILHKYVMLELYFGLL